MHQARTNHAINNPFATFGGAKHALKHLAFFLDHEFVKCAPRLEPGRMAQQVAQRYGFFISIPECRKHLRNGIVEGE